MHQDGCRQMVVFGGGECAKQQAVDHQQIGGLTRYSVVHVVEVGRRCPHPRDQCRHHVTVRWNVEHRVGTLQQRKTETLRHDTRLLAFVAGEGDVVASRPQGLGDAQRRGLVPRTIPGQEQITCHLTPLLTGL
jgi:hypothetical protein